MIDHKDHLGEAEQKRLKQRIKATVEATRQHQTSSRGSEAKLQKRLVHSLAERGKSQRKHLAFSDDSSLSE